MIAEFTRTMSIADAARRADMTPNGLRWHIDRGQVETIRTPLGRVIVRESFEAFLSRRAERAIARPAVL